MALSISSCNSGNESHSFNACEKATSQIFINEMTWNFEYDAEDRLIKSFDPGGKLTELDYIFSDSNKTVLKYLSRKNADGKVTFGFDNFGRLESMQDAAGIVAYNYNGFNRVTSVKRNDEEGILYTYNALDQLTSYSIGNEFKVEYVYDFLGRIKSMKSAAGTIGYEYWSGQSTVKRTLPNLISSYWKFNPDGKLESITHVNKVNSVLCKYAYSYGGDGLISQVNEWSSKGEKILKYGYDQVKRLVSYESSDGEKTFYGYDKAGNRTSVTTNGTLNESAEYDGVGKLLTHNGKKCSYDVSGNLTSNTNSGISDYYKYNASNKIKEANGVSYEYDGNGNLVTRKLNGEHSSYLPDPFSKIWKPLAVDGPNKSYYIWEGDHPIAIVEDGKPQFLLEDNLASVRHIVNMQGETFDSFSFSPFGIPNTKNSSALAPSFTGLFFDAQADLLLPRARAYAPNAGRFLQIDPLHQTPSGSQKDLGFYPYCGGDPVNFMDLNGGQSAPANTFWNNNVRGWFENLHSFFGPLTGHFFPSEAGLAAKGDPNYLLQQYNSHMNTYISQHFPGQDMLTLGQLKEARVYALNQFVSDHYGLPGAQGPKFKNIVNSILSSNFGTFNVDWFSSVGFLQSKSHLPTSFIYYGFKTPWLIFREEPGNYSSFSSTYPVFDRNAVAIFALMKEGDVGLGEVLTPGYHGELDQRVSTYKNFPLDPNAKSGVLNNIRQFLNVHKSQINEFFDVINIFKVKEAYGDEITASDMPPSNVGGVFLGGAGITLQGLDNITGIAVDKATGRLVLIGKTVREIALPSLRVDDIVTIFRSVYNGEAPYVSIDPNPENPKGNIMLTRHSEATLNTYVGWVLFQTDRIMKGYSLSKDNETGQWVNSKVPGYKEVLDAGFVGTEYGKNIWTRFWIVPGNMTQSVSTGENVSLFAMTLKVNTQQMKMQNGELVPADNDAPTKASKDFAEWFTGNYDAIAEEALCVSPAGSGINGKVAVFKELKRIALITAIAENLRDNRVPFPFWMREYKVKPLATPVTTPAITVKTVKNLGEHTVYGGVNLSIPKDEIKMLKGDADANKMAMKVAGLATKPFLKLLTLEPFKIKRGTKEELIDAAVSLPGAETKALAPCTLQATDLQVPLKHGGFISLERFYNSFFNPNDIFGEVWTLNLPKLEQQKMPYDRTEGSVKFSIQQNITTPLNSINSTAVKVYEGKNYNIGYKTSMVVSPDNTRWHFDNKGNLVGIENSGFTTVYKRDKNQRVERIEGWYYRNPEAHIYLTYSKTGKVIRAEGSNDERVNYIYDEAGNLIKIERQNESVKNESVRYAYSDKKVEQIYINDKLAKQFTYNPHGQLLKEANADKGEVNYQVNVTDKDYIFISSSGNEATVVEYNGSYMPTRVQLADKSTIKWTYNADHSVNALLQTSTGEKYKMNYSGDGRKRSLQLPEGGIVESEFDENRKLLKIKKNEEVALQQVWQPDGTLAYTKYGNTVVQTEYNQSGEPMKTITGIKNADNSFSEWVHEIYDDNGQIVTLKDYSGKDISLQYSKNGDLSAISANKNLINIDWNTNETINKIKTSWNSYQSNRYRKGKLDRIEIGSGKYKNEINFIDELPSHITQFDGGKWYFSYYNKSQNKMLCEIKAPNDLSVNYSYDNENRLNSVAVGDQYRIEYSRDDSGRMIGIKYKY